MIQKEHTASILLPEVEGTMLLRNVGIYLQIHKILRDNLYVCDVITVTLVNVVEIFWALRKNIWHIVCSTKDFPSFFDGKYDDDDKYNPAYTTIFLFT